MTSAIPNLRKERIVYNNTRNPFHATTASWYPASPRTLKNSSIDKYRQTFNGRFEGNPLSNSFCHTPRPRYAKKLYVEFSPPKKVTIEKHDHQIFDILVSPRYSDLEVLKKQERSRSPTSNKMYGTGMFDVDVREDKKKNLHYISRLRSSNRVQGDKITNISKTRLQQMIPTKYMPQAKAHSHEIGIENCDKMGGKNLGHYVKRV